MLGHPKPEVSHPNRFGAKRESSRVGGGDRASEPGRKAKKIVEGVVAT